MKAKKTKKRPGGRPRTPGGARQGTNLYLPKRLVAQLRREAQEQQRSLSAYVAYLLSRT